MNVGNLENSSIKEGIVMGMKIFWACSGVVTKMVIPPSSPPIRSDRNVLQFVKEEQIRIG